jgi:hypothetical protein
VAQHMQINKFNREYKQNQGQNYMIITTEEEKDWQDLDCFHDKSSKETRNRRTKTQHNRAI